MAGQKGSTTKGGIRWRPTAEQLMILEELFKGGIKTPTSQQVQKITTRLKEHGKVETKNVFYWFQNHKAREKQKIRRKLMNQQMLITTNNVVYYTNTNVNHPRPLFASGFLPSFPPQVIKGQWVSSQAQMVDMVTTKDEELAKRNTNVSSWAITWLPTDSDSDGRRSNRPLETLQLFPTTASATTETSITAPSSSTAVESNICSSSRILISL